MSFYSKSHDLVVVGTNYSMYVVTSLGSVGIMRMVFVTILNPLILEYLKVFTTVAENRLGWVYGNDPIPHMTSKTLRYVGDMHTLVQHLKLWKCLDAHITANGPPCKPGHRLLDKIVALWNRLKCAIDVYSRFMKNTAVPHHKLPPVAAV